MTIKRFLIFFFIGIFIPIFVCARAEESDGSLLSIQGVSDEVLANIQTHLQMSNDKIALSPLGFPRSNEYILHKVKEALHALGYYQGQMNLSGEHSHWELDIELGQRAVWGQISIQVAGSGQGFLPFEQFVQTSLLQPGRPVHHGDYESEKNRLIALAHSHGFVEAHFTKNRFLIAADKNSADLDWVLDSGERYRVNQVLLSGSSLSDEFLARYLTVKAGDSYQLEQVFKTQQNLNRSGYFSQVQIEPEARSDTRSMDIHIRLFDAEKYLLKTQLGYGSDSGGKLGFSWQDTRVNQAGHNYQLGFDTNRVETTSSFQYKLPLRGDNNEWLNRYSFRYRDDELAISKTHSFESRLLQKHSSHWFSQAALVLATEQIASNQTIEKYLEYLTPLWQINYFSVDDPFKAVAGWRWQAEIRAGHPAISDPDLQFVQVQQAFKRIDAFSEQWRMIYRLDLGYTHMDEQEFSTNMPSSYRFFAGGDASVRGYRYQTLGPRDEFGELIGGKHLVKLGVELDRQISESWRGAIFYDVGNAFNHWHSLDLKRGLGLGVRWVTPIGSIRIDYARSLDLPKEWRWHITIGPDL